MATSNCNNTVTFPTAKVDEAFNQINQLRTIGALLSTIEDAGESLADYDLAEIGNLIARLTSEPMNLICDLRASAPSCRTIEHRSSGTTAALPNLYAIVANADSLLALAANDVLDGLEDGTVVTMLIEIKRRAADVKVILDR